MVLRSNSLFLLASTMHLLPTHVEDEMSLPTIDLEVCASVKAPPTLPLEIWREIVKIAFDSRSILFIVDQQFQRIETQCKRCTFLSLALVCTVWHDIAAPLFYRELVVDRVPESVEAARHVERQRRGSWIRSIDASGRGSNNAMPPLIAADAPETMVEAFERQRCLELDKSGCVFL